MEPIILASASARRQEFFRLLGLPFTCMPAEIDETPLPGLSPQQVAEDLALRKTLSVAERIKHNPSSIPNSSVLISNSFSPLWIFGADTIVVLDNEIFGKPADRNAAKAMLERLAGRRHEVITAMALYKETDGPQGRQKQTDRRSIVSEVTFTPLSKAEIEWYLDTGEWEGAAGSYRLQEKGACFISAINGSPSGVAGLPLHEFYAMLRDNGYPYTGSGS
jgi:septum formation protein